MNRNGIFINRAPQEWYENYYSQQATAYLAGTDELYSDYFAYQAGNGMNYFAGFPNQRGHGWGSMFGGLWRAALPLLARAGRAVGKQALATGSQILGDIAAGQNVGATIKSRVEEGAEQLVEKAKRKMHGRGKRTAQSGGGPRNKILKSATRHAKSYKRPSVIKKPFPLK